MKGRLLTCYSPVRRSSTPEEAFPLDLHVLSTPPAFVLSQDQTLQQNLWKSVPANNKHLPKESPTSQKDRPEVKLIGTGFTKHPVEFSKNNHTRSVNPGVARFTLPLPFRFVKSGLRPEFIVTKCATGTTNCTRRNTHSDIHRADLRRFLQDGRAGPLSSPARSPVSLAAR